MTSATHPLDLAKTLIQIGHEPIAPKHTKTWLGRPALALPSVFIYMGHIRRRDGFLGLYRGLGPKLVSMGVSSVVSGKFLRNGIHTLLKLSFQNKVFFSRTDFLP